MNNEIPKISVVIITYNQEVLIKRALDSVLVQKEWVYEIIVCDDCSKDNNWEVIKEYAQNYPDLIKPFRNERNLGIFGNLEISWPKPTGDAIIYLSGDDALCNRLFEEAVQLIRRNNIDYKNDSFCLYFDYKIVYPKVWMNFAGAIVGNKPSNILITKGFDPLSLKVRNLIVNRTIIYSRKIQNQFTPVRKDIGIFADGLIDIQVQQYATSSYYSPFIGSVYYAKIGVSVKTPLEQSFWSRKMFSQELVKIFVLRKDDIAWLDYINAKNDFLLKPKWNKFLNIVSLYRKSINWDYGLRGLQLGSIIVDVWYFINRIGK